MIADGLDDIGNGYNSLEERFHALEKRTGRPDVPQTICQRLITLESRMLSYERQARDAVDQFKDDVNQITSIKDRIKTAQTDISDHTSSIANLSKSFHDANAQNRKSAAETNTTLERLINRVNELERKNQYSANEAGIPPFTSGQDLAEALLTRLRGGDVLEPDTMAQLKTAIGSSKTRDAPPTRLPDTPPTDLEPPAQIKKPSAKRKRPAEQEASPPAKRAKTPAKDVAAVPSSSTPAKRSQPDPPQSAKRSKSPAKEVAAVPSSSAPVKKSQPAPARQPRASPRRQKTLSASAPASATTSFVVDGQPDSPQPRRTSRAVKATKRGDGYMTWLQVKEARSSQNN